MSGPRKESVWRPGPGGARLIWPAALPVLVLLGLLLAGCSGAGAFSVAVSSGSEGRLRADAEKKPEAKEPPKPPKEPPGPHTLFEALGKYCRCLRGDPDAQPKIDKEQPEQTKSPPTQGESNGNSRNGNSGGNKQPEQTNSPPADGKEKDEKKEGANGEDKKKEDDKGDKAEAKDEAAWYSAHAQATVVTQVHDRFRSPYVGPNSLLPVEPAATSETTTLFFATRLWEGGELVFNPEVAGGLGFSGTLGVAGFPNGEITRVRVPEPRPYIARLFFRQTCGFGGEQEKVEDGVNQVAGWRDVSRLTLTVGKFTGTDVADDNRYSHDPRTQFLPWS